jgi:AraC family transcriptional regulator of adaptative response / DNA-3-methyladenine glycosylase II
MEPLVAAAPGRRVPGCAEGGEIAIRAVLGQQVSLSGAATLAGRLVAAYGEPLQRPLGGVTHAFPAPDALAEATDASLAMPASRRRAIRALADALAREEVVLDPDADRHEVEDRLLALPGIGPWTASYISMRALRNPDAFLPSDLGVKHALDRLGLDSRPAAAEAASQAWRPFRAYALQHLWAVAA